MPVFVRRLAALFAVAGCAAACVVALMVVVSIVGRNALSWPVPGDVELTQFGIALCISLCLPWCQLRGGNIIVDFFTQNASAGTLRRLDAAGAALVALFTAVLAWRTGVGAVSVREAMETTMILDLPMWWSYAVLVPGLALTAVVAALQAWCHATGRVAVPEVAA